MKFTEIRVPDELKFADISSEYWREYEFCKSEEVVRIAYPIALNVSPTGSHRIIDSRGISHYIPADWKHISWAANPHFTF